MLIAVTVIGACGLCAMALYYEFAGASKIWREVRKC